MSCAHAQWSSSQCPLSVYEVLFAWLTVSVLTRPSAPANTTCRIGLFRQFPEIYNLQHTTVWSFRRSTKSANGNLEFLATSQQLLKWFPSEINVRSVWFTDEKTLTAATPFNSQHDSAYSVERKIKQVSKRRRRPTRTWTFQFAVSWNQLVCLEWRKLVLWSLNQVPK